jgi:hypothetical protein
MFNYNRIIFKDNETPLNAVTMNHLEIAIHKLANYSLFPSDLEAGEGIQFSSTKEGKLRIDNKNKSLLSVNVSRFDVVYKIPEDATMGELYLLLDEETNKLRGMYWGTICIFSNENNNDIKDDNTEDDGTL